MDSAEREVCILNVNRIFISEFDAEERLRKANSFSLPALSLFARRNDLLLQGMDGLAIVMAEDGDRLVTRVPLAPAYLHWWSETFCRVKNISPDWNRQSEPAEQMTIYRILQKDSNMHELLKTGKLINYAAVPDYYELCEALAIACTEPPLSAVETVSRKSWTAALRNRLFLPPHSVCVTSPAEYDRCVHAMLEKYGSVLIKDSMGVSGRGILPIDSVKTAERLSLQFHRQEEEGKKQFDFVLEPYLNKAMDFSCQFQIDPSGNLTIDGFQKNTGKGFGYRSSCGLDASEQNRILSSDYLSTVSAIAKAMAEAGYFGYACIDSMITEEEIIIPLVEINPRMSMGRFNLALQKKTGKNCRLSYVEGTRSEAGASEQFLSDLEALGLLYTAAHPSGIIPLAPSVWQRSECAGKRIRIYYAVVYDTEEDYETLLDSWLAYCAGGICSGAVA